MFVATIQNRVVHQGINNLRFLSTMPLDSKWHFDVVKTDFDSQDSETLKIVPT